jgi:glycosyltransferase involved in cell wall biosynthesis
MMNELAIVIPAYKIDFFEKSLASIDAQTNKNFNLYIIIDGSTADFESIIERYSFSCKLVVHRFLKNLGRSDLVAAWDRSLNFVGDEEWIWLFSDDDEMDPECVQKFYLKLNETHRHYDLYRFNNLRINAEGKKISNKSNHPIIESSEGFLRRRLNYETSNFISEYIFRKKRFYECEGFVSFPAAWATDDATWIKLGLKTGICTIGDATVKWRQSDKNVSGSKSDKIIQQQKKKASLMFVNWAYELSLINHFKIPDKEFLQWLLTMMKIVGYKRKESVYPLSLIRLKTFKLSSLFINLKFIYKWYTDPDPYWLYQN